MEVTFAMVSACLFCLLVCLLATLLKNILWWKFSGWLTNDKWNNWLNCGSVSDNHLISAIIIIFFFNIFMILIFTWGQFSLPGIVIAWVRPFVHHQVCSCDNSSPVQARLTKFGPKMQNCFVGVIDHDLQGQILLKSKNLPHFELVPIILHHPFQLGSPNLEQRCKIHCLRSLLFVGGNWSSPSRSNLTKKQNFLVSPLLEIHNNHITTREPWVPASQAWLFHDPHPLYKFIYLDYFMDPNVSQSHCLFCPTFSPSTVIITTFT